MLARVIFGEIIYVDLANYILVSIACIHEYAYARIGRLDIGKNHQSLKFIYNAG